MRQCSYRTLESLTSFIAKETLHCLSTAFHPELKPFVTIKAAKPCALVYAAAPEIEITRTYDDFLPFQRPGPHTAVLALGSNLADRFYNIEYALRLLEEPSRFTSEAGLIESPCVTIVDTSFLYETAPMYVTDQPAFINGACMVI